MRRGSRAAQTPDKRLDVLEQKEIALVQRNLQGHWDVTDYRYFDYFGGGAR